MAINSKKPERALIILDSDLVELLKFFSKRKDLSIEDIILLATVKADWRLSKERHV
jgi:hypothetical protein